MEDGIPLPYKLYTFKKIRGNLEVGNPRFLLYIKKRPIVVQL